MISLLDGDSLLRTAQKTSCEPRQLVHKDDLPYKTLLLVIWPISTSTQRTALGTHRSLPAANYKGLWRLQPMLFSLSCCSGLRIGSCGPRPAAVACLA